MNWEEKNASMRMCRSNKDEQMKGIVLFKNEYNFPSGMLLQST